MKNECSFAGHLQSVDHRKNVAKSFVKTIPASTLACKRTVYRTMEHLSYSFSAGQKENTNHYILTENKLDNIGTQMETSPRKSLCQLAVHSEVSKSSADMATELSKYAHIKLQPYNSSFLRLGSKSWYYRWFQESVAFGFLDLKLVFFFRMRYGLCKWECKQ
jgi:hypothetical protein